MSGAPRPKQPFDRLLTTPEQPSRGKDFLIECHNRERRCAMEKTAGTRMQTRCAAPLGLALAIAFMAAMATSAHAQTFTILYAFQLYGAYGSYPFGGPAFDRFGNLYGTMHTGGTHLDGTVYDLSH